MIDRAKQDGRTLEYASEELKNDKEVVLAAVEKNSLVFKHVSRRLKNDKDILLAAKQYAR